MPTMHALFRIDKSGTYRPVSLKIPRNIFLLFESYRATRSFHEQRTNDLTSGLQRASQSTPILSLVQ